jgi:hypothetical protein
MVGPHARIENPGISMPNNEVNIWAWRPISMMSNTPTTIKAFFGVHNEPDLYGNRVRIHRSKEIVTSIHEDNTWATYRTNDRKRQSP